MRFFFIELLILFYSARNFGHFLSNNFEQIFLFSMHENFTYSNKWINEHNRKKNETTIRTQNLNVKMHTHTHTPHTFLSEFESHNQNCWAHNQKKKEMKCKDSVFIFIRSYCRWVRTVLKYKRRRKICYTHTHTKCIHNVSYHGPFQNNAEGHFVALRSCQWTHLC